MRTTLLLATLAAFVSTLANAQPRLISPANARPPSGPYSPGILAGDFLYVSGQGAARLDGTFPDTPEAQVEQSLARVRAIVEAAGLTMRHVVYAHLYLKDISAYDAANRAWARAFPNDPPARAVLGVAQMPTGTPVEITVVAYRHLDRRRIITPPNHTPTEPISPAVIAGDRLYLSGILGRGPTPAAQLESAFSEIDTILTAAKIDRRHLAFVNPYLTDAMPMDAMNRVYATKFEFGNTPARATIRVNALPHNATISFTGVAAVDLSQRRAVRPKNMPPSPTASPCVFIADTFYCSAKSGFIPGPNSGIYAHTVETQLRQTMRNLLDGLEEAGLTFSHTVATNVYLDSIDDFAPMNKVYAEYFSPAPPNTSAVQQRSPAPTRTTAQQVPPAPTRTTVQQIPPAPTRNPDPRGRHPTLEQISLIAVK